jgi:beta-glucanase (GH16 family)
MVGAGLAAAAERAPEGWTLAWADEFDGAAIDRSKWDFDLGNGFFKPFYLIMNLAVGGGFPGNPDATTKFPVEMLVDYVRVHERTGGPGPVKPRGPGRLPFGRPASP